MIEILVLIAVIGSVIAGIWDLLTTEVPDELPALMISIAVLGWFLQSIFSNDFSGLFLSLSFGTALLLVGLLLYWASQWGAADAWILAAIGYLMPVYNGRLFMPDFIPNFLVVSTAYMVLYALVIGVLSRNMFYFFMKEFRENIKYVVAAIAGFSVFAYALVPYAAAIYAVVFVSAMVLFWVYGKAVEKHAFRKKIPSAKLKPGDVLEGMRWRGLTEEEIAGIRRKHKFVVIKEGVRFVLVFPITLIVTLLYGNILFLILFG